MIPFDIGLRLRGGDGKDTCSATMKNRLGCKARSADSDRSYSPVSIRSLGVVRVDSPTSEGCPPHLLAPWPERRSEHNVVVMVRWSSILVVALVALFMASGCLPDFSVFDVIDSQSDGSPTDSGPTDSGPTDSGPTPDHPIDLGRRCADPHLAVALSTNSTGESGRLRHYNINNDNGSLSECHEADVAREQGAFGSGVNAVTGMPDGSEVIAVDYAILRLDDEGFPLWRWQLWDNDASDYSQAEVFPVRIDEQWYIGVLHCDGYCSSVQGPLLLDLDGNAVTHVDDIRAMYDLSAGAPHPDGSSRLLLTDGYGPVLAFSMSRSTTELDADVADTVSSGFDIDGHGTFSSLEVDVETQRMAATLRDGVALWSVGQAVPSAPMTCGGCTSYASAAIDPTDDHGAYIICSLDGQQSLLRMNLHTCEMMIDGSTLGQRRLVDVALVRGELR